MNSACTNFTFQFVSFSYYLFASISLTPSVSFPLSSVCSLSVAFGSVRTLSHNRFDSRFESLEQVRHMLTSDSNKVFARLFLIQLNTFLVIQRCHQLHPLTRVVSN